MHKKKKIKSATWSMLCKTRSWKICRPCSPRSRNEGNKRNLLSVSECFCTFVITAFVSPWELGFHGEGAGPLSHSSREQPLLQLAAEAQFGGFLINLSCQMLYDKMVKIGGRSGGGGVKVHFAKQTNSKSLDFTNYRSLWLFQPLFSPPHQRMNWQDKIGAGIF